MDGERRHRSGNAWSKFTLAPLIGAVMLGAAGCGGGVAGVGGQQGPAACSQAVTGQPQTVSASGPHYAGEGVDIQSTVARDANYGVNGIIVVRVVVACPSDVAGVAVAQSYQEFGSNISTSLTLTSHKGDAWEFGKFADDLNRNQPYQVTLYRSSGSSSPQPIVTVIFQWPKGLTQYMAN